MTSSSSNVSSIGTPASVPDGERKRQTHGRGKNFHHHYLALCRAGNFKPIPEIASPVRSGSSGFFIDMYCDRLAGNDWQLITKALSEDRSLQRLALRLRKAYTDVFDGTNAQRSTEGKLSKNVPVILEKRLLKPLIESLSHCLAANPRLEFFTLEGFPLAGVWTNTLASGLKQHSILTELSLARSSIGDEGCEALCRELKYLPNLLTLNLTACLLTERACQALADTIKFQNIQRYDMSWELSLRYREIKEEKLFGLKCLYLSHNPAIGDGGLLALTEVLKDDAWVRQVHMCNCGLTDAGAQFLMDCLNVNASIETFNIGENMNISSAVCHDILTKLGVQDIEGGDGPESVAMPVKKSASTFASLREQCELYKIQLQSERERNDQLESTVAQLHLRLGDYAMQINDLQRQLSILVNEQNELHERLRKAENRPVVPKALAVGMLKKSQSETLMPAMRSKVAASSASEMPIPCDTERERGPSSKTRVIERSIGDSCAVVGEEPDTLLHVAKPIEAEGDGVADDDWEPGEMVDQQTCLIEKRV
uniref:Uncharacterized protein n=1 Tax=Anopheles atroparvus TaxID=41427 RepID=A0AAG5DJX1_ANOAO